MRTAFSHVTEHSYGTERLPSVRRHHDRRYNNPPDACRRDRHYRGSCCHGITFRSNSFHPRTSIPARFLAVKAPPLANRNILADVGLGSLAAFPPVIMTLGALGEGHYLVSGICGLGSVAALSAAAGLLRQGTAGYRKILVGLAGVVPAVLATGALSGGHFGPFVGFVVLGAVLVGVGLLLKKAAEY